MATKQELHTLIDRLPEDRLDAAAQLLRLVDDPVAYALLSAPPDDEPETEEERAAVVEAEADSAAGRLLTDAEVRRELGL